MGPALDFGESSLQTLKQEDVLRSPNKDHFVLNQDQTGLVLQFGAGKMVP